MTDRISLRIPPPSLLEGAALPSVFTLGKGFAECSTRQRLLGKIFLGKGSLPSAFYRGTQQNKKKFAECLGRHSAKYFRPLRRRPLTVILPSARPSTRQKKFIFLKNYFAECPSPGTRQSFFLFFLKSTLPSAPAQALSKVFFIFFKKLLCRVPLARHSAKYFFLFFLNNFFAECPCLDTRQRISGFFLKKYFAECRGEALGKEFFFF